MLYKNVTEFRIRNITKKILVLLQSLDNMSLLFRKPIIRNILYSSFTISRNIFDSFSTMLFYIFSVFSGGSLLLKDPDPPDERIRIRWMKGSGSAGGKVPDLNIWYIPSKYYWSTKNVNYF